MKTALILNDGAGSMPGAEPEQIQTLLRSHGIEADLHVVDGKKLVETAKSALDGGAELLIAGGGDGTLAAVAGVIAGTPVTLGVLPLGTLNHFSKDAAVPAGVAEAIKIIATGVAGKVDVGEVNGRLFINNSSIGLYPKLVKERDKHREAFNLTKFPAMALAALSLFQRLPTVAVRLSAEGETATLRTPFVFIGNNVYEMSLFSLGTRKVLDGGQLSLYTSRSNTRFSVVRLAFNLLLGRLEQERDFESRIVTEVWIESKHKRIEVALDGEVEWMTPPLHYRIRPQALRVMLPRSLASSASPQPSHPER